MNAFDEIIRHQKAWNERLYLVASENSPSITARLSFLTDIINRYYFPLEKHRHWAFPGNEFIERIYSRCTNLLREATGARYVNIRPISGMNAMTVALAAFANPGDTIATIAPRNGGHPNTQRLANRLGLNVVFLPYLEDKFKIDANAISDFSKYYNISLIYLDQAQILFPHPLQEIRQKLPADVKIYYDGSHVMGLIFGDQFQKPLNEGASVLGGSTHKTIPGPHKAFIATNSHDLIEQFNETSNVFISHDHAGDVAALTLILEEMRGRWNTYAMQVVRNAQCLARRLADNGFSVAAENFGYTRSHQIYIDTAPRHEAFEAVKALARHNIIVNSIRVPSIIDGLAIRIGVQEVTYCGATEDTMTEIADIFRDVLIEKRPEAEIKRRVQQIKQRLLPPFNRAYLEAIFDSLNAWRRD